MKTNDEIKRLKNDIKRLKELNRTQFNYVYEENQQFSPLSQSRQNQKFQNSINSINNNPIIYQKIVNTSLSNSNNNPKNLPLGFLFEYQKGLSQSTKASANYKNGFKRYGRNKLNSYLTNNHSMNKSTDLFKPPFKPGIFSYKKRLDISQDLPNRKNISKGNSSMLSQDLKFLDDNESILSAHDSAIRFGNAKTTNSSFLINLDKYKINPNDINTENSRQIHRNLSMPNMNEQSIGMKNGKDTKNFNKLNQFKILPGGETQNDNNSIKLPMSKIINSNNVKLIKQPSKIGQNNSSSKNLNTNISNSNQSLPTNQINSSTAREMSPLGLSPIPNVSSRGKGIFNASSSIVTESLNFFKNKEKFEKESRRLIVELLKINKNLTPNVPLDFLMNNNNINSKVLQQEIQPISSSLSPLVLSNPNRTAPSSNFFSGTQSPNFLNFSPQSELTNKQTSNSMSVFTNYGEGAKPYNMFGAEMNDDESKEKIDLINFLTTPRVMNMITKNLERQPFIFLISPNNSCYIYGIENYAFRWIELKQGKINGNFDMIKMISCLNVKDNENEFEINVSNGGSEDEEIKTYIIEASSKEMCDSYIKCLNYLAQLIKCKIFNKNVNFSSKFK